jgi:hypothetical protein
MAKYSINAQNKIEEVMHEFKHGELKSGKGGKGGTVKKPAAGNSYWYK